MSGTPTLRPVLLKSSLKSGLLCWIGVVGVVWCFSVQAEAQVVRDRSLPEPTRVTSQGNRIEITGGTRAGRNLFHSFERFSVPTGSAAVFDNDAAIANIFSRVTGQSRSRIDGELRANGSANLFLLNPNGIIFGPNASLNIGGSFIGTTANSLQFANGSEYSAINPEASPLLTLSVPVGLQFSNNSDGKPGQIQVQGNGHNLFLNSPTDLSVNRSNRPVGLRVNLGQTLALVGGDLALQGGNLTAAGGRIELGSVSSGQVRLEPLQVRESGWRLGYDAVSGFGDISLTQAASLEASGDRGGDIQVHGQVIRLTGASALLADTLGSGAGGSLTLRASERLRLAGFTVSPAGAFVSRLSTDVGLDATGQGGNLTIVTPRLQIENGGQVSSGTFGAGNAGKLRVQTETLQIRGGSPIGPSGLFVSVEVAASGNGGSLTLTANRLQLADRAQIAASTFGIGNAGTLDLRANQVELQEGSGIFAIVEQGASGDGNRLTLVSEQLRLTEGAQITTLTAGSGNAGDIRINASEIELTGSTGQFASSLSASVESEATGNGGTITVTTDRLRIQAGGEISTTTFGAGRAGSLVINAEEVDLNGGSSRSPSALFSASRGSGNGGSLTLNTDRLRVEAGGQIATSTSGAGNAGDLTIRAASVELSGGNEFGRSGLFASAIDATESGRGTGTGGNLQVTAKRLALEDGATISVSNFPSSASSDRLQPGQGGVGNLSLDADQILLDGQSLLTADSAAGDRGNIELQSSNILLRRGSAITANASGNARGGNIDIATDLLTAVENSDITANSVSNFGGRVLVKSEAVLGTQIRPQLTAQSDITAFSELGANFSGTVQLDSPIVDPSQGLAQLPETPIDADNQIAAVCAETEGSEFVVTGRGGLPEAPTQLLRGGTFWEDLRVAGSEDRASRSSNRSSNSEVEPAENIADIPVEAQGWQINQAGQVILVAQAATQTSPQLNIDCAGARDESSL